MSVFTSLGNTVMRTAAVNAIENSRESDLMADAAETRKLAAIQQDKSAKDIAASLQDFQSTYQIAMDVVSLAQAGVKVGEAGADLAQNSQQGAKLESNMDAARADSGSGEGPGSSFENLKQTPLGEGTVGQRFNDQQLHVLVDDPSHFTDKQLSEAGFSKSEIKDLRDAQKDGFTSAEAKDFMQKNKLSPQEQQGKKFKEDLQKALRENLNLGVNSAIDGTKKNITEEGKRAKEDVGRADELQTQVRKGAVDHLKVVDEIHAKMLGADSANKDKR